MQMISKRCMTDIYQARIVTSRKKIYSRFSNWAESDVGTPEEKHVVTLFSPWSFSEDQEERVKEFSTARKAMKGIHKTYKYVSPLVTEVVVQSNTTKNETGWEKRLDDLTQI